MAGSQCCRDGFHATAQLADLVQDVDAVGAVEAPADDVLRHVVPAVDGENLDADVSAGFHQALCLEHLHGVADHGAGDSRLRDEFVEQEDRPGRDRLVDDP